MGLSTKALRELANEIDAQAPDSFAAWTTVNGQSSLEYSPLLKRWLDAVAEFGAPKPSKIYDDILSGERDKPSPDAISRADKAELIGYATFAIRGERFSDGHLASFQKTGMLGAILRRFADLKQKRWPF